MKRLIYFKYTLRKEDFLIEKQAPARVISEHDGYVIANYTLEGKEETRAFKDGEYSEAAYLMSF